MAEDENEYVPPRSAVHLTGATPYIMSYEQAIDLVERRRDALHEKDMDFVVEDREGNYHWINPHLVVSINEVGGGA